MARGGEATGSAEKQLDSGTLDLPLRELLNARHVLVAVTAARLAENGSCTASTAFCINARFSIDAVRIAVTNCSIAVDDNVDVGAALSSVREYVDRTDARPGTRALRVTVPIFCATC